MTVDALTRDDILQAKQQLEAEGHYASADRILTRIGRGSKKTVLRYLRELPPAPGAPPDPAPVPTPAPVPVVRLPAAPALERRAPVVDPAPVDPVAAAAVELREKEEHFEDARRALVAAKLTLLATRPLLSRGFYAATCTSMMNSTHRPLETSWSRSSSMTRPGHVARRRDSTWIR